MTTKPVITTKPVSLFKNDKLPYLFIGLLSLIGLVFNSFTNQLFYDDGDIVTYTVTKSGPVFNSSKKIWSTDYIYFIKNISKHKIVDTVIFDFQVEPDALRQKNQLVTDELTPIGSTSIADAVRDRMQLLATIKIWNYLPGAEYSYRLRAESIKKDDIMHLSSRSIQSSSSGSGSTINIVKSNFRTQLLENKLVFSFVFLSILIIAAIFYTVKLFKSTS
jgi:hypothetical protein